METREKGLTRWFAAHESIEQEEAPTASPIHSLGPAKRFIKASLPRNFGNSLPLSHLLSVHLLSPEPSSRIFPKPGLELKAEAAKLHPISEKMRPLTRADASRGKLEFPIILTDPKLPRKSLRRKYNDRCKSAPRRPVRHLSSRSNEAKSIPLKDALRDAYWGAAGRDAIKKEFARVINASNGVNVSVPASGEHLYKYYIGPGNNAALIDQLLKGKKWWSRVKTMSESNLVWSQRKEQAYLSSIPSVSPWEGQVCAGPHCFFCPLRCRSEGCLHPCNVDVSSLHIDLIALSDSYRSLEATKTLKAEEMRLHNKLECNYNLANKKALYLNMKRYYSARGMDYLRSLPLTFHVSHGETDPEFVQFIAAFKHFEEIKRRGKWRNSDTSHNLWIVKPGENSNQGRDITVASMLEHVKTEVRRTSSPHSGRPRTYIIQKYIERPFLYKKRKFDIRCYSLITSINGVIQGYYYPEGYIRTSSKEFDLKSVWDLYVHLTNDAVQKHSEDYGKYEPGNKLTYGEFQRYLELRYADIAPSFQLITLPRIRELVKDTIMATFRKLDPSRHNATFEVFGYDFMLETDLRPLLIEVNTNPCLELTSAPLLKVIPRMLEGAFRIVLDSIFPEPPNPVKKSSESLPENRWELLFNEIVDGAALLEELTAKGTQALVLEEDPSLRLLADDEDLHSDPGDISSQA
jgi:hypothetical protein